MPRVNTTRFVLFAAAALVHLLVILFAAFKVNTAVREPEPAAEVLKLVDRREAAPPPPPRERPPAPGQNTVEAVAETMIETETPP